MTQDFFNQPASCGMPSLACIAAVQTGSVAYQL